MLPGFTSSSDKNTLGFYPLTTTATALAAWQGPGPMAETPVHNHNYVELLFEQPANFTVPASQTNSVRSRVGFNLTTFISAAGLKAPVRANYWQVPSGST